MRIFLLKNYTSTVTKIRSSKKLFIKNIKIEFKLEQSGKSFLSVFCITLLFVLQRILLYFREYEEILKYN